MSGEMRLERVSKRTFRVRKGRSPSAPAGSRSPAADARPPRSDVWSRFATAAQKRGLTAER